MRANLGKVFELFVLCASLLVVAACGGGGGAGGGGATPVAPNAPLQGDALFTASTSTINVAVVSDVARTASQVVTSAGATISAVAADGSQFTLVIPASAVTQSTTISMTPLVSVSGVPFASGVVAAVQFEPDGLALEKDAILTIVPAINVPVQNQTPISFLGGGNDLHLAPMVVPATPGSAIQLRIGHFSGAGIANGTYAERAALLLKRAADHQARLEQEAARYLLMQRQQALLGASDEPAVLSKLMEYLNSYYGLVVRPRILAASSSCANAKLAAQTFFAFERNYGMYNGGQASPNYVQDLASVTSAYNSTCTAANRYTGTFTQNVTSTLGGASVTGTITFLRDDVACAAAGISSMVGWASTACYREESVSYTVTPFFAGGLTGWTYTPASKLINLTNTPVNASNLVIDLSSTTGPYQYLVTSNWNPSYPNGATITPPAPAAPYTSNYPAGAGLLSNTPAFALTDGKTIAGGFTAPTQAGMSVVYTWNLTAAP